MTDTALIEEMRKAKVRLKGISLGSEMDICVVEHSTVLIDLAIEALEQSQLVSQSDLALLLSFAPKDTPEGLFPTFYHTLTYEGDKAITDRLAELRKNLKPITPPTQESDT